MNWFTRLFTKPETETPAPADWREEKLKEAARRYGKTFKCGPDGLPREVFHYGTSNVTPIKGKRRSV